MSQENVEIVRASQPVGVDFVTLFGDDDEWRAFVARLAPLLHTDFECVRTSVPGSGTYYGTEGLRMLSLDWLAAWAAYRTEIDDIIDCGDQVVVLHSSYGRLEGSTLEVKLSPGNVWTLRDGKIARVEYYAHRDEALKAVALEE